MPNVTPNGSRRRDPKLRFTIYDSRFTNFRLAWACLVGLQFASAVAQDEIELLSGTRISGKIIERTEQSVRIQITVENRPLIRSYPLNRVGAITQDGQRQVLSPRPKDSEPSRAPAADSPGTKPAAGDSSGGARTLDALIGQMGRTPPDWFEATPLEYPETLDLSWPEPTPIIWNYTRNVDHYLWDIVNSNPKRYRSGVRFVHHLLVLNQMNESVSVRAMNELGRMYFEFFRDYARAAFWWRQAKVDRNPKFAETPSAARLAECYYRLGDRAGTVELLDRLPLTPAVIKAWGDLKETDKALRLCDEGLKRGFLPSQTYLLAGDACRASRDFSRATEFYRRVLALAPTGSPAQVEQIKRDQDRARDTIEVIRLFDALDVRRIPDGTYAGKSLGYSGNVEVEALVKAGRIDNLKVTHHSDRQYYHAIEESIRRILEKQTVNGVDAISGATVTSEAVIRASAKALAEGMGALPAGN
ncbi:MAG: FMN-binding protein [Verrucomicrobia bacterium]|nr:FMN-binding protein [Verrucomicrobiota bacterium]